MAASLSLVDRTWWLACSAMHLLQCRMSTTVLLGPLLLTVKLPSGMGAATSAAVLAAAVAAVAGWEGRRTGRVAWMSGVLVHDAPAAPVPCDTHGFHTCSQGAALSGVTNYQVCVQAAYVYIVHGTLVLGAANHKKPSCLLEK